MMVSNKGSILNLIRWQLHSVMLYTMAAIVALVLYELSERVQLPEPLQLSILFQIPGTAVAIVGGAIGIFVSFRTNSAYDRWWEGRKLWGRLINTSRHFSTQALSWIRDEALAERLVRRHIAYVHTLRCLLRTQDPFDDAKVRAYLTAEELEALPGKSNTTHAILHLQHLDFTAYADDQGLDPRRLQQLDESVRHLLDIQGGCERIKKTPLPRGYGFIAERLIRYFSFVLPFALVPDLHLLVIPINVMICLSFALISEAGRVLEDPFTLFWNGLPLFAMSRTIENDLLSRMGEEHLEPLPGPDANGILM